MLVAYTTAPFVVFVHLRLPAYARHPDRALLRRFVRSVPPATLLDVTTMNLAGRPRVATVTVGDLVPARERLGIVNLAAVPGGPSSASSASSSSSSSSSSSPPRQSFFSVSSRFPWIHLPPATKFGAPPSSNSRGLHSGWVWDELLEVIERRAAQAPKPGL